MMKNALIIMVTSFAVIILGSCGGKSNGEAIKEKPHEDSTEVRATENSTMLTEDKPLALSSALLSKRS
jgi:hypothetical protein